MIYSGTIKINDSSHYNKMYFQWRKNSSLKVQFFVANHFWRRNLTFSDEIHFIAVAPSLKVLATKNFVTKSPICLKKKKLLATKCKTIIIFSDDYFSSLILPYSDENIFVTNTIHRNTYSDEIFHH